jgi:putative membrane protein
VGFFFGPGPGHGGPFVVFLAFLVAIAIVVLAILFIRQERMRRHGPLVTVGGASVPLEALRILDERFAKGEIDAEDYQVRRDLLRGSP